MLNLFLLFLSLFFLIKSADYSSRYATNLAMIFGIPKYIVGFIIVAFISVLPEAFISIESAYRGVPEFGLGTLFGSNVADLTIVFAIIIFISARGVKIGSQILKENKWYPFLLSLPILVGFDGFYSRVDGILLISAGIFFYYLTFRKNHKTSVKSTAKSKYPYLDSFYLIVSMAVLLFASHSTVKYGIAFGEYIKLSPVLIGMLIVGLGTTLPELFFSMRSVRENRDDLALGDILGTVISDATILVGLLAIISPFHFPPNIIYVTAVFMVLASLILFNFMRSGRLLNKKEASYLALFYLLFVMTEYWLSTIT